MTTPRPCSTPTPCSPTASAWSATRLIASGIRRLPDLARHWSTPADAGDAARPDIFVYDPSFENPETLRISLGYEREIVRNFSLGINVIWQDTKKLQRKWDQNIAPDGGTTPAGRPTYVDGEVYDDFDQIMQFFSDAEQEYRAVIIHGQKRFADRWFLDFSYTWSSSKDHDSNERSVSSSSDFPQDQFNLDYSWGYSNFDATHKFVTNFGWQLPANFMVSGIFTWRSGFPYSANDSNDNNGDGYRNETAQVEVSPGVFEQFDRNTERQPSLHHLRSASELDRQPRQEHAARAHRRGLQPLQQLELAHRRTSYYRI